MAKPASPSRLTGSLIILALLLGSTTAFAQEAAKSPESDTPESEEAVFIPIEFRPPPWQVSVGLRLAGKAKVNFSQLGAIPANVYPGGTTASDSTTANQGRTYTDGEVYPDSTYALNSDGSTYSKVAPTDGKTNYWAFSNAEQVVDMPEGGGKAIAFHAYAVESDGATAASETNGQMTWDIEISRELGSNRRMSWGILFGAAISDIRCKTDATVKAKLRTLTDYYSLTGITLVTSSTTGAILPLSYKGSTEYYPYAYKLNDDGTYATDSSGAYIPIYQYDAQGNKLTAWSIAQRISTDPTQRTDVPEETASLDCIGHWEVKGAYMTARFGPYFAYQLTHRLALRASAGLTFTVVGARFFLNERVIIPAARAYTELDMQLTNESASFDAVVSGILGYYASGELNTFFTDRTGMFFGASYESFQRDLSLGSNYAGHQRADVSLSSGTILRTGITTRF